MLHYYKRHVLQLKKMLNDLDPGASDLRPLAEIEGYLINHVVNTERKVSKQQALRKSLKSKLREKGARQGEVICN